MELGSLIREEVDLLGMVLHPPFDWDPFEMVPHSLYSPSDVDDVFVPVMASHMGDWVESLSPISCEPLLMVVPSKFYSPIARVEEGVDALSQPSKWVTKHMNLFRQQIGVSIKGHESECLAMLMRIDKERKSKLVSNYGKKSGTKGAR